MSSEIRENETNKRYLFYNRTIFLERQVNN